MAPDPTVVFAVLALPFLAAAMAPLVNRVLGERTAYYAAGVALLCFALVATQYGRHGAVAADWLPAYGVSLRFYVDGLALLIAFLASGVGVLVFVYSAGYMPGEPGQAKYYATMLAFMGSMLGVAFAADLVVLFVFWELTSVCSFGLIGHYQEARASRYAARKSMLITVGGGLFMLVGFLLLSVGGNTFDLVALVANAPAVRDHLSSLGLLLPATLLVGVGAAAKSAQVPFHVWLPNAMEAPTPVSAFLHAATMVKAGVYLVGRMRPLLLGDATPWTLVFVTLGLVTMTVTAVLAVRATDIKELLAYSTASHLGLIVAGFGFDTYLGAETGAFHILNHALFKAPLFLVAGIVAHEVGTRRLSKLSGLARDLPLTAAVAVVAALGMGGVPPFNGFYSKELLFEAAYETATHAGGLSWLFPVVAVLGSVFTFVYSLRFLMIFFGDRPDELGSVHRPPLAMLAPPVVLALLAAAVGADPQGAVTVIVQSVVDSTALEAHAMHVGLPTRLTVPTLMSATAIGLGLLTYPVVDRVGATVSALLRGPVRANWWYDGGVSGLTAASRTAVPRVQNGLIRTYATWVLAAVVALALGGYAAASVLPMAALTVTVALPVALVLLVAMVAALAVTIAPSHVAGVLTLSILGFMVAIFFILGSAPDLALTQLVVETLVLLIFLLVIDKLPAFYGELNRFRAARDAALAVAVGATVTVTVLLSTGATPTDDIASYFVEQALPAGGGGNVVNVILVDFRGFDTMGEISVIAMAAVSVLTLIAMRERGETE